MTSGFVEGGPRRVLGRHLAELTGCAAGANSVILSGEPGAGRTTVLRELEHQVQIPVRWILGQDHAAEAPYASLVTMLRSGVWGRDLPASLLAPALRGASAATPPDPPQLLEHLPPLQPAAERTLTIVDDLQLLDRQSQAVVTALARRASRHNRSVILATCDLADPTLVGGLRSIELPPMTVSETRSVVEQSRGQGIPFRVAELLQRRTGGNPAALLDALTRLSDAQAAGLEVINHPLELSAPAALVLGRNLAALRPAAVRLLAACAVQTTLTNTEATAVLGPAEPLAALVRHGWVRTVGLDLMGARPAECLAAWSMLTPHERHHVHDRLAGVAAPESDIGLFHRAARGDSHTALVVGDAAVRLFRSGRPDLAMACALLAEQRPGSAAVGLATHYLLDGYLDSVRRAVATHHGDPAQSALTADETTSLEAELALLSHVDKDQLSANRTQTTGAEPQRSWFRAAYFLARAQLASRELAEAEQTLDLVAESLPAADPDLVALHAVVAAELLFVKGDVRASYLLPTAIQAWSNIYEGPFALELAVAAFRLILLGQLRPARALLMRHAPTDPATPALARSAFLAARMGVEISAGHFVAARETLVEYDRAVPYVGGGGAHRLAQAIRINAACGPSPERAAIETRLHNDTLSILPSRFRSTLLAAVGLRHLLGGDYERAGHELEQALRHVLALAHPPAEILADLLEAKLASGVDVAERHALFHGIRRALPDHDGERFAGLMARGSALTAVPTAVDVAFADALQAVPAEFEVDRARTLLAYGRALIRASRRSEAAVPTAAALIIFDNEGLSGWASHVRRLVATERLPAPDAEPLTEAERHIVALLIQRKTNREIASELFMSKRSLESQLTRIFRKLGVRRKSEILRDT